MAFTQNLVDVLKAKFPLVYVETHEESRVVNEIERLATDAKLLKTPRPVWIWSTTSGLMKHGEASSDEGSQLRDPVQALSAALAREEHALYVFLDLHPWLGQGHQPADATLVRKIRDVAFSFKMGNVARTLIIVSPLLNLPPELEKDVTILEFPLPSEKDITQLLDSIIEANATTGKVENLLSKDERERLVQAAIGLTLNEAENAFARAMVDDGKLTGSDIEIVTEEKRQIIRKSGLLEFIPYSVSLNDIGGLENLKRWLTKREDSWLDAAKAYNIPAPKGVLITGVPGCGKSLTAKAIAASWGLPLLRLDVGRIFSGLIGSSEQNMRSSIRTAEAIAPCILWIDEIEKGFPSGRGDMDGGTSSRVFGSFLTWMQEKTSAVFVVATANNIDRLPPEFLRKGRFDEIFFVDLPTKSERQQIWKIQVEKRVNKPEIQGPLALGAPLYSRLADLSNDFSGAEIEQAVIVGLFEAFIGRRPILEQDFVHALDTTVPLSKTQAEQIKLIREWANTRAISATSSADLAFELHEYQESHKIDDHREESPRGGRTIDM